MTLATGGVGPTAEGAKISLNRGEYEIVDGPFAEAKELMGGWALMECRDLAEAVEWSKRFLAVLGEGEVRVRPVFRRGLALPLVARRAPVVESAACPPPTRAPRSRPSTGSSSLVSSPPWRRSPATSRSPRSSPRTRSSTRCASAHTRGLPTTRAPGSPPSRSARRSTSSPQAAEPGGQARPARS